jgi:hypothetical protein
MSLQQNSAAVAAARAHVEAWGRRDYESARVALADDVWVTAIAADPTFPKSGGARQAPLRRSHGRPPDP